eukprot:scaffold11786_cov119-Isochrysis_galbana.AAC.4
MPSPRSPVHRQRKFSQVFGTWSAKSSITIRPARRAPIWMSMKTRGLTWVDVSVLAFSAKE